MILIIRNSLRYPVYGEKPLANGAVRFWCAQLGADPGSVLLDCKGCVLVNFGVGVRFGIS